MKDLSDWRREIDVTDREIVALLNKRARSVLGLAPLKRASGIPVREGNRERLVLDNVQSCNQGPLPSRAIERIFEAVMGEMRAMQSNRDE